MTRTLFKIAFTLAGMALVATGALAAQKNPMVGAAATYPAKDPTTLVAAVNANGVVDTLFTCADF